MQREPSKLVIANCFSTKYGFLGVLTLHAQWLKIAAYTPWQIEFCIHYAIKYILSNQNKCEFQKIISEIYKLWKSVILHTLKCECKVIFRLNFFEKKIVLNEKVALLILV